MESPSRLQPKSTSVSALNTVGIRNQTTRIALFSLASLLLFSQETVRAQEEINPAAALTSALVAACRQTEAAFARYLTAENAAAFGELPEAQRLELMRRFVLVPEPGRPLLSNDAQGHTIIRCSTPGMTAEIRLEKEKIRENLAFVPVEIGGRRVEMGLVREGGGWRILSVGLLLVNIPELRKQWETADVEAREAAVVNVLRGLAESIETYRRAFGALPERLEQLGPAPKEGVSPEAAQLVDAELAAGTKIGYRFRYRVVPAANAESPSSYELAATPLEYGKTGRRSFLLDGAGKLRGGDKQGAVATTADPVVEARKP
jgi:hypothetical protein